jgi:SAM-dependent methyltransferase
MRYDRSVKSPVRRWPFDALALVSEMVPTPPFDSPEGLDRDLAILARAYGVEEMSPATFDDRQAARSGYFATPLDYYTSTEAQFSGVHSPEGAVHFGLAHDGRFHPDGFLEQARIVELFVRQTAARDVLEIGSGKGINATYLARRNPGVSFAGVDITPLHVRIASDRGAGLTNLRFVECDFHRLAPWKDQSLDIVFDVEAGCYADSPERLRASLAELRRVLRPGGLFVTFGWCRANGWADLDRRKRLAVELVERAWVVREFPVERSWEQAAREAGFAPGARRDLREASMPSVVRLYRQARLFYHSLASPAKPLVRMLMRRSTHNAVSALMLPHAYGLLALEYRMAVLSSPGPGGGPQ